MSSNHSLLRHGREIRTEGTPEVVTLGKNQLLATTGRVLARVSKAATQDSDEKPQQIDLTKLGGTLLTSYKSKHTGDRYELWQFSVAGNDHRTIKLIHADYGETWTAYHPARDVWTDVRCDDDSYFTATWCKDWGGCVLFL